MFLQSTVVPICSFRENKGKATILQLLGTTFFIDRTGHFLTAKHVVKLGNKMLETGVGVGLVAKDDGGKDPKSIIARVFAVEDAPEPFDVAIGKTVSYKCEVADLFRKRCSQATALSSGGRM